MFLNSFDTHFFHIYLPIDLNDLLNNLKGTVMSRNLKVLPLAIAQLVTAEAELLDALSPVDQERLAVLLRKLSLDFD